MKKIVTLKIKFSLKEDFVIVPIDKAANNVVFISKHFYAQIFINNKTKDQIIEEHKLYLSKYEIDLANNMQDLPVMYWIPNYDKLLYVFNEINDFAFKGGNNSIFQVGSKIIRQVIGILMGSDPAPFFANLFLFFYESRQLKFIKNTSYGVARKFGNILRFIDYLIAINDRNKFENHYNEIYPPELILKKGNTSHTETTFLDLHLCINEGQIETSLYDKRNSYNFSAVRFPYKSSTVPSKIFFATISAEIL